MSLLHGRSLREGVVITYTLTYKHERTDKSFADKEDNDDPERIYTIVLIWTLTVTS